MIETWTALEVTAFIVVVVSVITPPIYAWADRWLDRTRNEIKDTVTSGDE